MKYVLTTHRSRNPYGVPDCRGPPHHEVREQGDPEDGAEKRHHEETLSWEQQENVTMKKRFPGNNKTIITKQITQCCVPKLSKEEQDYHYKTNNAMLCT